MTKCASAILSSAGLRVSSNAVRIATGPRLGGPLCLPHLCHHCGSTVTVSFAIPGPLDTVKGDTPNMYPLMISFVDL